MFLFNKYNFNLNLHSKLLTFKNNKNKLKI